MAQVHHGSPSFSGLTPCEGRAYWTLGMLMVVKVRAQDTGGRLSVCEFVCPPGFATPLHVHDREDETWWVIEGQVRYRCGAEEFDAEPGACLYLPLGIPHGFKVVGSENARLLHVSVPGGSEEFHTEMGVPTDEATPPPPMPLDIARAVEVGARYGMDIVGPPID